MGSRRRSRGYFSRANRVIPGGVNSPVRAWVAVGRSPLFIRRGKGAYIYDVDGNRYIDYCLSWGALILGHTPSEILSETTRALRQGTSFGAPTPGETELARLIIRAYPSMDKARLTCSGTEAVMSALRLARGYSGRRKIIKFAGCYHGHCDSLLVKAGSGVAGLSRASSAGVPVGVYRDTIVLPFNNLEAVEKAFARHKRDIAAVIVEPIAANMGVVLPRAGFLKGLREITQREGVILIFDEVITGFRVAWGGAQGLFGIRPDITVLGKIVGGGFPLAAFGGRRKIMDCLAPQGPVYQAGTLAGNPVAVAAGMATIKALMRPGVYDALEQKGRILEQGLQGIIRRRGVAAVFNRIGSLWTLFWTGKGQVRDYDDVCACDKKRFARFFRVMLRQGVYLSPSQFEANFISLRHKVGDIEGTIKSVELNFD